MKYSLLLLSLLAYTVAYSQSAFSFYTSAATCNGESVVHTDQLEIYQTTNGLAGGPRDSTFCYTIDRRDLELLSFVDSMSLFVRVRDLSNQFSDAAYTGLAVEELDYLCYQEETTVSMHYSVLKDSVVTTREILLDSVEYSLCDILWGSETRTIVDWYFEIKPITTLLPNLPFIIVANQFETGALEPVITVDIYRENVQAWEFYPENEFYPYLTAVVANHCDSTSGVCYTELLPAVDTGHAQIIIPMYSSTLIYDDYAGIRGGLVAGSLDERYTVVIEEQDFGCVEIAELHVDDGVYAFVSSGSKGFLDGGCIMMNGDSEVRVGHDVEVTYGTRGMGILGMNGNTKVTLGENSKFVVDGQLMLSSRASDPSSEIHLGKGSKLVFTDKSSIRSFRPDEERVVVYVHDGSVDLTDASDAVKQKLHLVYDETPAWGEVGEVVVVPNPVRDYAAIHAAEDIVKCQILDISGRLIASDLVAPSTSIHVDLSELNTGVHIVRCITLHGDVLTTRVVIAD